MNKKIKVLVVSNPEWSDQNSFGNTISNFFSDLQNEFEFASIYTRNSFPDNNICNKYLKITFLDILKNFFRPQKIGMAFNCINVNISDKKQVENKEKKVINLIHKLNLKSPYLVEKIMFKSMRWKNKKFDDFIKKFNPDIIFSFVKNSTNTYLIVNSILKDYPKCKFISYIGDDVYGVEKSKKNKEIIQKMIYLSSKIYGASTQLCEKYNNLFDINCVPIYKSCDFQPYYEGKNNTDKIKIVYAGNLYYGRDKILIELSQEISALKNEFGFQIELYIYSNSVIDHKTSKSLNIPNVSTIYSSKSYGEIKNIMNMADIVLHVESNDSENKKLVKYSFSTKIIDCMQSYSVIMAIGSSELASIDYIKNIPGSIVLENIKSFYDVFKNLNKKELKNRANQIRNFAIEHHDKKYNKEILTFDFNSIIE